MRKKIVAGNWKMNKTASEARILITEITAKIDKNPSNKYCTIIVAPPFTALQYVGEQISNNNKIFLAAQNCHSELSGAYTGEIALPMLKDAGCSYVIIGHSERRAYFHEDDMFLSKKVNTVLSEGLTPIFCCGESLNERKANRQEEIVKNQLKNALFHLNSNAIKNIIVAYEPVWAIGTGVTATSEQAQEMHLFIRKTLASHYDKKTAEEISILYGGSCNAKNAEELFNCPDVDGGLIGGASLIAEDFVKIVNANHY